MYVIGEKETDLAVSHRDHKNNLTQVEAVAKGYF